MYTIEFLFEEKNKSSQILCNVAPNQSLLDVALSHGIELHHNCGGVCACSTCHIYIELGGCCLEDISDKEEDFIDRAKNPKLCSRLACQCILLEGCGDKITVTIPDQSIIQGE